MPKSKFTRQPKPGFKFAAEKLHCSPPEVKKLLAEGLLVGYKIGRSWRFTPEHIEECRAQLIARSMRGQK